MKRTAEDLLRQKIAVLLHQRGWSQIEFAERLGKSQAWVSRKLTGVQAFRLRDLDAIAGLFAISLPELFFDEYGQWDRRSGGDRRKQDRRRHKRVLYDPKIEIVASRDRLHFPIKE